MVFKGQRVGRSTGDTEVPIEFGLEKALGRTSVVSYALSRPARSPSGNYYEVCASPRGDLLVYFSETGPQTWFSTWLGSMGILSFLINRMRYAGRWQVVVRPAQSRADIPTSGILWRDIQVQKREVDQVMQHVVNEIEAGHFAAVEESFN